MAISNAPLSPIEVVRFLFEQDVIRTRLTDYPLLAYLLKKTSLQSSIRWQATFEGSTAVPRAIQANAGADSSDQARRAELSIGEYVLPSKFSLVKTDIVQAGSAGVSALQDLLGETLEGAIQAVLKQLADYVYTGDGSAVNAGVVGLEDATSLALYAGIDNTNPAYAQWVSVRDENGGVARPLTSDLFINMERDRFLITGRDYDAIFCSPGVFARYRSIFLNQVTEIRTDPNPLADIGVRSDATFRGIPVIQDRNAPAGTLYAMNRDDAYVHTMLTDPAANVVRDGFNWHVHRLPENAPHVMSMEISLIPQLCLKDRRSVSVIADVQE